MARVVPVFNTEAIAKLQRDHQRLQDEVRQLRRWLHHLAQHCDDVPACHFTLSEDLATSDSSATATVKKAFGGRAHEGETIEVYNSVTHTAGTYDYSGDNQDNGKALYNVKEGKWYIWDMECP